MINNLPHNLKRILDDKQLTVWGLEQKAGLKKGSIRNIVSGRSKRPGVDLIIQIARELECEVEDLVGNPETFDLPEEELHPAPSSKTQSSEKNDPLWDMHLLHEVTICIFKNMGKKIKTVKKSDIILLIEEIYDYSATRTPPSVDKFFVHWLVQKICAPKKYPNIEVDNNPEV